MLFLISWGDFWTTCCAFVDKIVTLDTIEKGKKTSNTDLTISMKILLHYLPTCTCTCVLFLSSNSKIPKASLTFPSKIKPTILKLIPSKRKKMRHEKQKIIIIITGEKRKQKVKAKTAVSLLNPKTISKLCFLRVPEANFCI